MNKRAFYTLATLLWCAASSAVEFEDYDYSRFTQEVTECDRPASHGRDPGHVAPAVSSIGMDKAAAIATCHEVVLRDPENPRLNYQLGRAYDYSGRGEEAMPYRLEALEADYPQTESAWGFRGVWIRLDPRGDARLFERGQSPVE